MITCLEEVIIECCRATGDKTPYMKYTMTDVFVGSYSVSGGSGVPSENVSFNYGKIEWSYTETEHGTGKAGGKIESHWDCTTNTGG